MNKISSYERMISIVNRKREPASRCVCSCGKEIFVNQLEKHQKTDLHAVLLLKKKKQTTKTNEDPVAP